MEGQALEQHSVNIADLAKGTPARQDLHGQYLGSFHASDEAVASKFHAVEAKLRWDALRQDSPAAATQCLFPDIVAAGSQDPYEAAEATSIAAALQLCMVAVCAQYCACLRNCRMYKTHENRFLTKDLQQLVPDHNGRVYIRMQLCSCHLYPAMCYHLR